MKISVIGLGFVGTVTGASLAELGHDVIGVDSNPTKVEFFASGRAPISEPGIDRMVRAEWDAGRLSGTTDMESAIARSDLSFICVGTKIGPDGAQDIGAIESAAQRIGRAIARKQQYHSVVVRSTMVPGTTRRRILTTLEHVAGAAVGERFGLAVNPEFMREGSALADFHKPPRTVIGEMDAETADRLVSIYSAVSAPIFRTSIEVAEIAKYTDNSWHALKVTFINEIASICEACGLDSRAVTDIFNADEVLNISQAYLRPGFAFGGPCLPADVAALAHYGAVNGLDLPVLSHIIASNERLIEQGVERILRAGRRRIGIFGLAYKAGVSDLRGSPSIALVNQLIAAGCSVRAFDPGVFQARKSAAQHDYTERVFASLEALLVEEMDELLGWAETIVFTTNASEYSVATERLKPEHVVIDFAGMQSESKTAGAVSGRA